MIVGLRVRALSAFLAVAGLFLVGCSSALTIPEYIDGIESVADAYVTEAQSLSYDYQSGVEDGVEGIVASSDDPEAEAIALVRSETMNYLALLEDAIARFSEALGALDPPEAVADPHDAYHSAVDAVLVALPGTREAIADAGSLDDIAYAMGASGFADGQDRWTATCEALEQAVRDEGKGVDLKCVAPASQEGAVGR